MKAAVTFSISLLLCAILAFDAEAQHEAVKHSIRFQGVPLQAAIDSLMKWFPESIIYVDDDVKGKTASASCNLCNFDEALGTVLNGTSLTWERMGNQVILKRRESEPQDLSATVAGTITDSLTGEWIAGASVVLQNTSDGEPGIVLHSCPANDFGFFSLPHLAPGSSTLAIRALGYESIVRSVTVTPDGSLYFDFKMMPKDIVMQEVTVEGRRAALTSVEGISRGVYLRSVPTDPNQYVLDGGRIYNPTHFGGVLSTFSPEVLNDVQVVAGGLPPSFGGRLGGFVDLSLRDGSRDRLSGSATVGTLGSTLSLGGPFSENTTFLFSGRRGYPDASMEYLHAGEIPSRQRFTELVGKVTHRLSGSGQVSLSAYFGGDSYTNEVDGIDQTLDNDFSWENGMVDLRWVGIVTPSLFLYASAGYSQYGFDLGHSLFSFASSTPVPGLSSTYGIEDFSLRVQAEDYYDEDHTVRGGAEILHHRIHGTISNFSSQIAPFSLQNFMAWEASVYLQDQWKLLPGLTAEFGARATNFLGDKGTFSGVDPRFSLRASLGEETVVYGSLSGINQFIHPYRNSGIFLLYPSIFWYPSTDSVRPSTSLAFSLGTEKSFSDETYSASVESYYRVTNNLNDFGLDTLTMQAASLNGSILFGTGRIYGLVCTFQKRTGSFTGSISYNLSWSVESFVQVNGGKEFPSPSDRRHEVQVNAKYSLGEHWTLGALCVVATGPSSLIPFRETTAANERATSQVTDAYTVGANASYGEYLDVNGGRLPGFQRLEFTAAYRADLWNVPCRLTLRLLNSYGLLDPFAWNLQRSRDIRSVWNVSLKDPSLVPLYPAIGLSVRF